MYKSQGGICNMNIQFLITMIVQPIHNKSIVSLSKLMPRLNLDVMIKWTYYNKVSGMKDLVKCKDVSRTRTQ